MSAIQIYGLAAPVMLVAIFGALAWWNLRNTAQEERRQELEHSHAAE